MLNIKGGCVYNKSTKRIVKGDQKNQSKNNFKIRHD